MGDVVFGSRELMPIAQKQGQLLGKKLYSGSTDKIDYVNIPVTILTPIEYGSVGYTEADAKSKFGEKAISVYHTEFKPLEWAFNCKRPTDICYVKMIINKPDSYRVIGFHMIGPNVGEIT